MTECIFHYIYQEAGCQFNWSNEASYNLPVCKGVEEIEKLSVIMWNLHSYPYAQLKAKTGHLCSLSSKLNSILYLKKI